MGTWAGETALLLAGCGYQVFAIDHWLGNRGDRLGQIAQRQGHAQGLQTFCRNMGELLYTQVFPVCGDSITYASVWPSSKPIDFLYIDASHDYEGVKQDIENWSPHVRPGGIIAGHDYDFFPGVTQAVIETGRFQRAGKWVWWRRAPEK